MLVYDISDPETLDNTAYWMKSIRDTAGSNRVQICLVGNKVRLLSKLVPTLVYKVCDRYSFDLKRNARSTV